MALAKIKFEIEVEDTFQNGSKLDTTKMYKILAAVAEKEYDSQFQTNKLVKRFQMIMHGNDDAEILDLVPAMEPKRVNL